MNEENNIFSNKIYLKQINKNFDYLIKLIHSNYTPITLPSNELSETKEISFEFLQEFNGLNQNEQMQLLSTINYPEKLWKFLSLNPTSYDCQAFIDEFYQLISNSLLVKQHLSFHFEDFLLILSVSYDDDLRYNSFKIVSLLMNHSESQIKHLNRICYEYLYNFDIYYEKIKSYTIESRILNLTKENLNNLINGEIIEKDLEEKIIETINELGGYVFMKMHRSPKDAYQNLSKEIHDEWSQIWGLKSDEDPQLYFMKIQNVNQLKLLFKTSDRLREDLQENSSEGKLILRKWIDHLPNEYRCFVCHGKLNAVSSYQSITNENELIKDFINSKIFQNIILAIPYSHGVVDCTIDSQTYQVQIIEINPFSKRASAGKFSWIIDKEILYYHYDIYGYVYVKF